MLTILPAQEAFAKAKVNGGSILMEPNIFASNFLIRSADKFGIYDVPSEVLYLADNQQNMHIYTLAGLEPFFIEMVLRPVFNNTERIFEKAKEDLLSGVDIYATPGGSALFLKWLKTKGEDVSFEMSSEFTFEDLSLEYSKLKNRDSIPMALERLLKLWFFFYGKKVSKEDTRLAGFFQQQIIEKNYEGLADKADKIYKFVEDVKNVQTNELPSNNIFNKLLEELYLFSNAIRNKGEIISTEFDIIQVNSDKIEEDKKIYQDLFS